jgi:hypothetical protein
MVRRALYLALLACVPAQIDAAPATAEAELRAPIYYLGRADPRLCPSPMCGGLWMKPVNGVAGNCRRPAGRECYVTGLVFPKPGPDERTRARLGSLVASGRGLVHGSMTAARIEGFPELRALNVHGVWRGATRRNPTGAVHRLLDNGVRCVTTPCFSIQAAPLGAGTAATVSNVDLSGTGASAAQRRWARKLLATRHLIAAGRIARDADGGRTFVATQLYFRDY